MDQNILTFDVTESYQKVFKSYGKVCRPSLFCGKMDFQSVSETCARLRVVAYGY